MKYLKKDSSKRIRPLILVVSMALILCLSIGGTIAYLVAESDPVENTFTASEVKIAIDEVFTTGDVFKENVSIQNVGDTDAYVKAMVTFNWKNGQGQIIPAAASDYDVAWGTSTKWSEDEDAGIYYYSDMVPVGGYTENLINKVEVKNAAPADGYVLHVEVIASAIQATPGAAVSDWQ